MKIFEIKFDKPYYDDLPPEEKTTDEIILLLLMNAAGENVSLKKYNEKELNTAAGQLIDKGFLRGTIFDRSHCSWSRLTRKGQILMATLKS